MVSAVGVAAGAEENRGKSWRATEDAHNSLQNRVTGEKHCSVDKPSRCRRDLSHILNCCIEDSTMAYSADRFLSVKVDASPSLLNNNLTALDTAVVSEELDMLLARHSSV